MLFLKLSVILHTPDYMISHLHKDPQINASPQRVLGTCPKHHECQFALYLTARKN